MEKLERLRKNSDFKKVYSRGKSIATYNLVLYFYPNKESINRIGFSISKKIGNAVVRNKLKRRLREIMRLKKNLKWGYDLVIIARKPVVRLNYTDLKRDIDKLFFRAGIVEKEDKR